MRPDEIKQKLRQLKRLEEKIRFGGKAPPDARLVWDRFFDTRGACADVKYPLDKLSVMSREEYKAAVDAYLAYVYYQLYSESDAALAGGLYDPEILKKLGLPPDAGTREVKHRFRELAKQYHPDTGGDAARFIDLMAAYRQLIEK